MQIYKAPINDIKFLLHKFLNFSKRFCKEVNFVETFRLFESFKRYLLISSINKCISLSCSGEQNGELSHLMKESM